MEYIPIKTRIMHPPKDDLFEVLDEYLTDVQEGDVVVISSKVVAIHEGRCILKDEFDKAGHISKEADVVIPRDYWNAPLTIINHMLVGSAGIDQSNSDGYYTLLPATPFLSAESIHAYLKSRFSLRQLGVVISDSRSVPCRLGAIGAAISWWGFLPLVSHIGEKDLFGRVIEVERSNLVDGIAAGANVVMGEVAECQPVVIARDVPNLTFKEGNSKDDLFVSFAEDTFRVLYERFLK